MGVCIHGSATEGTGGRTTFWKAQYFHRTPMNAASGSDEPAVKKPTRHPHADKQRSVRVTELFNAIRPNYS